MLYSCVDLIIFFSFILWLLFTLHNKYGLPFINIQYFEYQVNFSECVTHFRWRLKRLKSVLGPCSEPYKSQRHEVHEVLFDKEFKPYLSVPNKRSSRLISSWNVYNVQASICCSFTVYMQASMKLHLAAIIDKKTPAFITTSQVI